jgi:predicted Zn-dependent peptidase
LEQFNKAIYGNHPASLVAPPADSVKKLTSKDLSGFHSTYYRPNNSILTVVGDVTLKEIMPKIEKAFGDWQKGDIPNFAIPPAPAQSAARIFLIDRPGSVQTVLTLGTLGIERTSPDYFAVLLADKVLGGGPSGRLFLNLREDKGYTYGAYSGFGGSKFRGTWTSSSEVRTDVTDGAMTEFMNELKRLRTETVPAEELENAKRSIIGSFALSLEQPQSLLQNIVTQKLCNASLRSTSTWITFRWLQLVTQRKPRMCWRSTARWKCTMRRAGQYLQISRSWANLETIKGD